MAVAQKVGIGPVALAWALTALAYGAKAVATSASTPLLLDSDDAMRLNEVHDFLGGQNWFDLVQHRLNVPYGAELHWSRLVDLPEAALLSVLRPLAGAGADTILAWTWPLLLLVPLLWLTARLALDLGGRAALWPALLLAAASLITMGEFAPGRLDHHSAQILCTLVMAWCAIRALADARFSLGAGAAAALALAIGIEGLPMVLVTVLVFALAWVASERQAAALRDFGISFGLCTLLALAQGVPPWRWLELRLDAISCVYAAAALLTALAFAGLSVTRLATWPRRLAAALAAGAAIVGLLLWLDPATLRGPYAALDPWLVRNWLARIAESESFLQSLADDPVYPLAVTVPVLTGLGATIWNVVLRRGNRGAWLVMGAFLLGGLLVMLVQVRAARLVTPLAVPADAVLVAAAWQASRRHGLLAVAGLAAAIVASAGLAVAVLVALVPVPPGLGDAAGGSRAACLQPAAFTDLAGLPPERIMAPIDLGSHLLLFTPHAVVGAPYHRNQQGLLDTFRFFNRPIAEARDLARQRGIGLVVICPAMKEIRGLVEHTPDSFVSLYAEDALPGWLVKQELPGSPLEVYAITP